MTKEQWEKLGIGDWVCSKHGERRKIIEVGHTKTGVKFIGLEQLKSYHPMVYYYRYHRYKFDPA